MSPSIQLKPSEKQFQEKLFAANRWDYFLNSFQFQNEGSIDSVLAIGLRELQIWEIKMD